MKHAAGILITAFALGASLAQAQSISPDELQLPADEFPAVPDIDRQVGSQGVDVISGRFTTQSPAISIGDPGAGGLSYQLLYDGTGMRHSVTGGIAQVGSNTVLVSFMGSAEEFTFSGGSYAPVRPSGSTLTYASGLYTYQTGDGSIIEFRAVPGSLGAVYGYNTAYVERFQAPNGQELSYTYTLATTDIAYYQTSGGVACLPGPSGGGDCQVYYDTEDFIRLQSVTSNQGYQLHFEYQSDALAESYERRAVARFPVNLWLRLERVQAINLAEVWCAASANECSVGSDWPHLEFENVENESLDPTEVTIRDALGNETVWSFSDGKLDQIDWLDASGQSRLASKTISYDSEDRVSTISQGGLSWTTTRTETSRLPSNDPLHPAISTLEVVSSAPDGTSSTSYVDRSNSRVYEMLDAAGQSTFIEYDAHRRPQRVTYPEGNAVEYAYDSRGNVTTVTQIAKPGSGLTNLVTSIAYPATCTNRYTCNQPTSVTTPDGGVTSYQYFPAHGGVDRITAPAVNGEAFVTRVVYSTYTARYHTAQGQLGNAPMSITLPERTRTCMTGGECEGGVNERVTRYVYGVSGQANNLQVSDIFQQTGNLSESLHTHIAYNAVGDVVSVDGPVSGSFDASYIAYDALRRQTYMAGPDPDGSGALPRQAMHIVYDAAGRVEERHSGTVTGGSAPNWATFVTVTSQSMDYDALGRPTAARNLTATGVVEGLLQYAYDTGGRLTCTAQRLNPTSPPTDACTLGQGGVFGTDRIQRLSYDAAGRVESVTDALSQAVVSYAYTDNGLLDTLFDGNGNSTRYRYDGFDRQRRILYANGEDESEFENFTYDAAGRLETRRNRAGDTFGYGYDALGRVQTVDAPGTADDVAYTYNAFNQIKTISAGGETLTNVYNALGWLLSQTGPDGAVSYQYDAAGRRERLTWPGADDFYVTYAYDHASRIQEIRERNGTSGMALLAHYEYDDQGRLESILRGNGVRTGFAYDAASRLDELATELEGSTPSEIRTLGFEYNPAGQITERSDAGGFYRFDGHTNQTTVYDHNALNQIIDITETGAVTRTLTPVWTAGNLTSDGERSFGYDPFNRLSSVTGGGQSEVDLGYDPLGRLSELDVTGGLVTRFQYDGAAMIAEYDGSGAVMRRYVHGPGMDAPLVRYDYTSAGALEGRRWLLADERGSIYAHADEAGAIIQINTYDEYGRPGDSNQGRFGYTGQIWLAEAGLYHYKARAYHAELGVFMQADPIGHSGGINLYAYVAGDPINFTDPWGLSRLGRRCENVGDPVHNPDKDKLGEIHYTQYYVCEDGGGWGVGSRFGGGGPGFGSGDFGGGSGGPKSQGAAEDEGEACADGLPVPPHPSMSETYVDDRFLNVKSRDMLSGNREYSLSQGRTDRFNIPSSWVPLAIQGGFVFMNPDRGSNARSNLIRIMLPGYGSARESNPNAAQYPNGYYIIYNSEGQPINVNSGRTGPNEVTHHPIEGLCASMVGE